MADIEDLLGNDELDYAEDFGEDFGKDVGEDYEEDFGEVKVEDKLEEDKRIGEEEDVLGIGKEEIIYEHDQLILPQPNYSQKSWNKDASGIEDSKVGEMPGEKGSCEEIWDVKSNEEQMPIEECIPEEIWEVHADEQILHEDENSKEEMWEIKTDEPQHSPLPSPDRYDEDKSPSVSPSQEDSDDESEADDIFAAVFDNWNDQEEEKEEQNKQMEVKDEQNKLNSEAIDDEDIAEEENEAEEKRRQRSRFKTERTNITFNTKTDEKKEIVDSLDSVLVPDIGRGSLISFSIPKAKPLGSLAPIGSLGNITHENAPGQMDLLSLQLQEAKQGQFSNVQFSNMVKKAHKDTVNQTLREIPSQVLEDTNPSNGNDRNYGKKHKKNHRTCAIWRLPFLPDDVPLLPTWWSSSTQHGELVFNTIFT